MKIVVGHSRTISGNFQTWNFHTQFDLEVPEGADVGHFRTQWSDHARLCVINDILKATEKDTELRTVLSAKQQVLGEDLWKD